MELCNRIAQAIGIIPSLLYDEYLAFIASNYGQKIKQLRKFIEFTQNELGQAIRVHRKTIARWEKKQAYPTRENYDILKQFSRDPTA